MENNEADKKKLDDLATKIQSGDRMFFLVGLLFPLLPRMASGNSKGRMEMARGHTETTKGHTESTKGRTELILAQSGNQFRSSLVFPFVHQICLNLKT